MVRRGNPMGFVWWVSWWFTHICLYICDPEHYHDQPNNRLSLVKVLLDQWKIWPLSDFCKITKEFQNYEISVRFYLIYGIQADSISCDISWSWWGPRYNPSAKEAIRWWFHLSLWHQLLHQPLFSLFGIPKWKIALYPDCKQFLKSSLHMELGSFFVICWYYTLYSLWRMRKCSINIKQLEIMPKLSSRMQRK